MKYLVGVILGVVATLAVVVIVFMSRAQSPKTSALATPTASPVVTNFIPPVSATPSAQPTGGGVATGTISGKLCYPSEFLPSGAIEAKNTLTNAVVSELYAGTEGGAANTYQLAVPAGTYILRYKAGQLYGYHTNVCPTGGETSCAAANAREHIEVEVEAGGTATGVDLCDFYYSEQTNPGF